MNSTLLILSIIVSLTCATVENSQIKKKDKRGVALGLVGGPLGFDILGVLPEGWNPAGFGAPWSGGSSLSSDLALGQIQAQATHDVALQALKSPYVGTPAIAYPPEVIKAINRAKEANNNVFLAQQNAADVKQKLIIQQKIALAKENAAREAAQRSEELAAEAQAEARASAQKFIALQQRLATLKNSVSAAQRVAAARESAAALAISKQASEAAAAIRKQDVDKQITETEHEAQIRDTVAGKENAVAVAVHQSTPKHYHPWG